MGDSAELVGVGPVRMVRTFRVGGDAGLYPVNTAEAWSDGWNTATCGRGIEHTPPDARCRCGFYAYAHPAYAGAQPPARQVLAVVAVQGEMEPGSRGARVQQARVEALWLGPRVSDDLASAVARRYPSVAVFRDRAAMLAAFPLTPMTVFTPPRIGDTGRRRLALAVRAFLALVLVVGLIPTEQTLATPPRAAGWLAILLVSFAIVAAGLAQRSAALAMEGAAAMQWLLTAGPVNAEQWVRLAAAGGGVGAAYLVAGGPTRSSRAPKPPRRCPTALARPVARHHVAHLSAQHPARRDPAPSTA